MRPPVLPAAADEVSTEIAALFSAHSAGYQQLSAAAALFHQQFQEAMSLGAATYAAAEINVGQTLAGAVNALGVDLGGALNVGSAAAKGGSEVAASAGRWVKLTEESARALKLGNAMKGSSDSVSRASSRSAP